MNKIFLALFLLSTVLVYSQKAACIKFHKENCGVAKTEDDKKHNWKYNSQSKSGLFKQGSSSRIRCVIFKGMDYRFNVCCETSVGDQINYKVFDSKTNELLYDNATAQNNPLFEFQSTATRQIFIEVTVPSGSVEVVDKHKPPDVACVGLLIEHKISNVQGFTR